MQYMNKQRRKFLGQYLVFALLSGVPAFLLALNPKWLIVPEPYTSQALLLLHIFVMIIVLAMSFIFLYVGGIMHRVRLDLAAAGMLAAGIFSIAAEMIPALEDTYLAWGRSGIALGIGLAMFNRSLPTRSMTRLILLTALATIVLVFVTASSPMFFSSTVVIAGEMLSVTALINGIAAMSYAVMAFQSRRLHIRRHLAPLLQVGFLLAAGTAVTYAILDGIYDNVAAILAAGYETTAYFLIGVSLLGLPEERPFVRMEKLSQTIADYRNRYEKSLREVAENRVMMRDVMQQVSTEKSHRLMREMFEQIQGITLGKIEYQEVLQQLVAIIAKSFGTNHVFLTLAEGDLSTLRTVAYRSVVPIDQMPWKTAFTRKVFTEAKTLFIEDFARIASGSTEENPYSGFRSMIAVPIIFKEQPVGVLEILSRPGQGLSSHDAGSLATFSEFASIVIHNAKGYTGNVKMNAELDILVQSLQIISSAVSSATILRSVTNLLSRALKTQTIGAFLLRSQAEGIQAQEVFNYGFSEIERKNLSRIFAGSSVELLEDNKRGTSSLLLNALATATNRTAGQVAEVLPLHSRGVLQGIILYFLPQGKDSASCAASNEILQLIANQTAIAIERSNLFESVREIGYTDALTGLANRRFFDFILSREVGRARRYGRSLSLMMLDIDYFKQINDNYGHPAGDLILKTMGDLLRNLFRKTDLAARYGGEEFIIILPETSLDAVTEMAERFRDAVSRTRFATENGSLSLTISIGVASLPLQEDGSAAPETDLLQIADQALYRAKTKGRNRVET